MVNTPQEIETRIRSIKPFLKKEFGIETIGYFGSFSNGTYGKDSDIDLLISYSKELGWNFFDIKEYLESILGRKVDLVTERSIKKRWKKDILNQVKFV